MPTDHDGDSISIGDNVWIPCQVTGFTNTNQLIVKTSYSGVTLGGNVAPSDSHKAGNFPDRP